MKERERLLLLKSKCPNGWSTQTSEQRGWKIVGNDGTQAFFKWTNPELVDRYKKYEHYNIFPKILWTDVDCTIMIREWINGLNWKMYLDRHTLTEELMEWYILENWRYWQITGGHGDFTWYNVIVTPSMELKWIDINKYGIEAEVMVNQLYMHLYRKLSKDEIRDMIQKSS